MAMLVSAALGATGLLLSASKILLYTSRVLLDTGEILLYASEILLYTGRLLLDVGRIVLGVGNALWETQRQPPTIWGRLGSIDGWLVGSQGLQYRQEGGWHERAGMDCWGGWDEVRYVVCRYLKDILGASPTYTVMARPSCPY
jgi:hypothetical protein